MEKDKLESRTWTEVGQQEKEACDRIYKQFGSLHAFFEYIKTHPETLKVARLSVPQQGQAQEYEHLTICNGDRRKPVSRKGGCCCLNVAEDYMSALATSRSEAHAFYCEDCGNAINLVKCGCRAPAAGSTERAGTDTAE